MALTSVMRPVDHVRFTVVADWLAVATAIALPWSTSATAILIVLLLLALIPTLDWADVRRELFTAAGGLPVLLVALGVLGMAWADVSWHERWDGLTSFFRLLLIPLLFAQFRRSERGYWVFAGYVVSLIVLLPLTSFIHQPGKNEFVIVKNGATQSGEFVLCMFGMLPLAVEWLEQRRWWLVAGFAAMSLGMLANMFFVATGRTALVIIPALLAVFALKKLSGKGIAILLAGVVALSAAGWFSSPYLRDRTTDLWTGYRQYMQSNALTSSGQRVSFYLTSLGFVREAPVIGHGTGTIGALFAEAVHDKVPTAEWVSNNPHNQTLAIAIQLGLVGAAVLWAMWIAHLWLFRGDSFVAWVGLVIVVQNMVGSLFNSHLFDFDQGWTYVLGVGVAGGMVLKQRAAQRTTPS